MNWVMTRKKKDASLLSSLFYSHTTVNTGKFFGDKIGIIIKKAEII
jgi:hypothetical protein